MIPAEVLLDRPQNTPRLAVRSCHSLPGNVSRGGCRAISTVFEARQLQSQLVYPHVTVGGVLVVRRPPNAIRSNAGRVSFPLQALPAARPQYTRDSCLLTADTVS